MSRACVAILNVKNFTKTETFRERIISCYRWYRRQYIMITMYVKSRVHYSVTYENGKYPIKYENEKDNIPTQNINDFLGGKEEVLYDKLKT